ncbi:GntR family transcriptional regulator [Nocardioides humi]|uniref:GntR family transcriptional regulator n=1 Tax=Nocardioides humi TaxID=449461 RepID=A0ABN1ZUK8_9ACTN|nr:GntR family transcriptional regulator [Nocardioides humi]
MGMHAPRRTEDQTRRIRDLLRASIVAGDYASNVLPSEEELRAEFDAPRACIREALLLLQDEGMVDRVRGQGTFLHGGRTWYSMRELHGVEDPQEDSIWSGRMQTTLIDWSTVPAMPPVARLLAVDDGEPVLRIDYVALLDGVSTGYATNYMAEPEAARVSPEMIENDFYAMLTRAGIEVGRSTFHIETALADHQDAQILDIVAGEPVMVLEEVVYDGADRPFDVAFCRTRRQTALFSRESLSTAVPGA